MWDRVWETLLSDLAKIPLPVEGTSTSSMSVKIYIPYSFCFIILIDDTSRELIQTNKIPIIDTLCIAPYAESVPSRDEKPHILLGAHFWKNASPSADGSVCFRPNTGLIKCSLSYAKFSEWHWTGDLLAGEIKTTKHIHQSGEGQLALMKALRLCGIGKEMIYSGAIFIPLT